MDDPAGTVTTYAADTTRSIASVVRPSGSVSEGELLRPGSSVGRYVVMTHVGAGGMGRVYAAHDPELDRKVALKLLRAERNDDVGRNRLVGEARALAKLAHPHVVAVHDVGTVGEQVFVAMEYVSGTTLRQVLAQRRYGWRQVLELLLPVARGLAAVHAAGLVHRDLKPDNIMLGDDGRVRLMDFGLARAPRGGETGEEPTASGGAGENEALTRTGTLLGTPPYMAPEQWQGLVADARTDQLAFCVTLWEALYGERPFAGGTITELERAITRGTVTSPARASEVPRWLRRVLERGLAVEPADRHPSMEALVEALAHGRRTARLRWLAAGTVAVGGAIAGVILGSEADPEPASVPVARCRDHEVCAGGPLDIPVCMGAAGTVPTDVTPCTRDSGTAECPAGQACTSVVLPEGKAGRCAPICQPEDDRPECVPGCYNQQCADTFGMCTREHGLCQPVPCSTDEACSMLAACDFPGKHGPAFRCNLDAGLCERVRP
jgi:predicted Ser/Thr protein kinase